MGQTRPLNSIFKFSEDTLQVVMGDGSCSNCYFLGTRCKEFHSILGYCDKTRRDDHAEVVFRQVPSEDGVILRPFDLGKAKKGYPVCTSSRKPVRILCFDRKDRKADHEYPILALVEESSGIESLNFFNLEGKNINPHCASLKMLCKFITCWQNIYKSSDSPKKFRPSMFFSSKEEALENKDSQPGYITTVSVTFDVYE